MFTAKRKAHIFVLIPQFLCEIVKQHLRVVQPASIFVLRIISRSQPSAANKPLPRVLSGCVSSVFVRLYARYCVLISELGC